MEKQVETGIAKAKSSVTGAIADADKNVKDQVSPFYDKLPISQKTKKALSNANVYPSYKFGATMLCLGVASYKFSGARAFFRNTLIGGGAAALYFWPSNIERAKGTFEKAKGRVQKKWSQLISTD